MQLIVARQNPIAIAVRMHEQLNIGRDFVGETEPQRPLRELRAARTHTSVLVAPDTANEHVNRWSPPSQVEPHARIPIHPPIQDRGCKSRASRSSMSSPTPYSRRPYRDGHLVRRNSFVQLDRHALIARHANSSSRKNQWSVATGTNVENNWLTLGPAIGPATCWLPLAEHLWRRMVMSMHRNMLKDSGHRGDDHKQR